MTKLIDMKLSEISFAPILHHSVAVEAGWVNNPNDPGKETKHGITYATAQEWKPQLVAKFGWDGTVKNLTQEMAMYVYEYGWWVPLRCQELLQIHPLIAQRVFDFGINAGRPRAGRALQVMLNLSNRAGLDYKDIGEDGSIGNATMNALKAFYAKRGGAGLRQLLIGMAGGHIAHYQQITIANPKLEEFFNGWMARLESDIAMYYKIYAN